MIRISTPLRVGIVMLACASPFLFPSALTGVLAFAAALVFPPLSILLGVLVDLLYKPGGYWPLGTVCGIILCVAALIVRAFVKARIM